MEDGNVDKMCAREGWETPETTLRKLRTLEIVLKDVENTQNWWFSFFFPIVFLLHEHIHAPTLFFFLFLDKIHTILSTTMDDKGRRDSCQKVHHHDGGDYNFLTQKKKIFLKINSSPPTLCFVSWIQQCTYGYVQYTYDNFNIKKNFVFWSWQPTMTTC